jgi:hypothetical protein
MLPRNLQSVKVAPKKTHRMNVQLANAAAVCRETLKRTSLKVQSVKTLPELELISVMSTLA